MFRYILLLTLLLFIYGCSSPELNEDVKPVELTVSAATSMQNVLQDLKNIFEEEHPTIDIAFNFGASGTLSQQISQGAPVDLFLSASMDKFDVLVNNELIHDEFHHHLIGNEIVLIVPKGNEKNIASMEDLATKAQQISIGIPEVVPVGAYAKEALVNMGLWNMIEKKLVPAKDVRQVLTYVETGNVDAGFVYKTDTKVSEQIQIIESMETTQHSQIIYPIGIIKTTKHVEEAKLFYEFLTGDEALALFEEYGFLSLK